MNVGEDRQVSFPDFRVRVGGEASTFQSNRVEVNLAYPNLSPHPALLFPGLQPVNNDV